MAIDLTNRVCVITGAAEGIGKAIARGFIRRGAQAVATDIQTPLLPEAAMCLSYDVSDAQRASGVLREVVERFGKVDAFIANAGIMPRQNWDEISGDDWRKVMNVNLDGAWHGAQAAAKQMTQQGYGKIIFVSSVEVEMGVAVHCHYDAAKAGLIGLTRALARAVGSQGVRVNCVMPGAVRTESELLQFPDQEAIAHWVRASMLAGSLAAGRYLTDFRVFMQQGIGCDDWPGALRRSRIGALLMKRCKRRREFTGS